MSQNFISSAASATASLFPSALGKVIKRTKRAYTFHGQQLLRMSASNRPVRAMKEVSRGEEGSLANSEHHAPLVKPFIKVLVAVTDCVPFHEWIQGNNVHIVRSVKGTEYRWRAMFIRQGDPTLPKEKRPRYYYGLKCLRLEKNGDQVVVLELTDAKDIPGVIEEWYKLLEQ